MVTRLVIGDLQQFRAQSNLLQFGNFGDGVAASFAAAAHVSCQPHGYHLNSATGTSGPAQCLRAMGLGAPLAIKER